MRYKWRLKLQNIVLLLLIPALLLVTVALSGLIYNSLRADILAGFDRKLSAISSVTGAFIDGDAHARLLRDRNENSASYRKYVEPMRRIRQKRGITFIYTQVLGQGRAIQYVLDGQLGKDHSHIGDADEVPEPEERGVREVMTRGKLHLSAIRAWQQWGLLKSGFAPIYDRKGRPVAMAGADVDISIIRAKTSAALAQVGFVSLLSLLIAGFLSMRVAGSLTRPLAAAKEAALQVAAGRYGHRIEVDRPGELAELAAAFNSMGETLATTLAELTEVNQALEQRRCRHELARALAAALEAEPDRYADLEAVWRKTDLREPGGEAWEVAGDPSDPSDRSIRSDRSGSTPNAQHRAREAAAR
jgi:methyl-accepting chemotaxis protein